VAPCHLVLLLGNAVEYQGSTTDEQKKILRFDEQPAFLARAQPYPAPNADLDKKMQDVWTEMLQAK
jgi:spermidine/putrescine transport system substrate-binding protein